VDAGRVGNAPQGPTQTTERENFVLFVLVQDIRHGRVNVSNVGVIGRFSGVD
jgi:hypothetical protein